VEGLSKMAVPQAGLSLPAGQGSRNKWMADRKGSRNRMANPEDMWQCQTPNCGYIYNPDRGDRKGKIPKGTPFADLPEDWKCPLCGAGKKMFRPLAGPGSTAEEGS